MSKIKIVGHASGSGVLTIAAPNTNTDRTITIPDVTGTLLDSGSALPAANLTGTIADARFPTTLPARSAVNLTALNATNLGSGTVPTARLGSGTANTTTFLRGDGSWQTAGSTSASDLTSGTLPIARIADGAITAAKVAADVATQAEIDAKLSLTGGTMTGVLTVNAGGNLGFQANGTTYTQIWQTLQSPNDLILKTTADKYMAFQTNSSEKMRILSAGNVGINDTTPTEGRLSIIHSDVGNSGTPATLHVHMAGAGGTGHYTPQYGLRVTGSSDNYSEPVYGVHSRMIQQNSNGIYGGYFGCSGNYAAQYGIYSEIVSTHCATGGGVYGAYVKAATGQTTGTARFIVGLQVDNVNAAGSSNTGLIVKTVTGSTSNDNHIIKCYNDGVLEWKMQPDGDSYNTNNTWGSLSDSKLKENIVDANSQWADIKALKIRNYNFKADTGHGTHTQIGIIAQETESISPGLVNEVDDMEDVMVEGYLTPQKNGETTKSIKYSVLYMKAIKALQEAQTRIETLETKVTALENA